MDEASGCASSTGTPQLLTDNVSRRCLLHGDIIVDLDRWRVYRAGHTIPLCTTEFRLLCVLIEARGRVLSCADINERLYNSVSHRSPRSISVYIARLRRALVRFDGTEPIVTTRGGYLMETAETKK